MQACKFYTQPLFASAYITHNIIHVTSFSVRRLRWMLGKWCEEKWVQIEAYTRVAINENFSLSLLLPRSVELVFNECIQMHKSMLCSASKSEKEIKILTSLSDYMTFLSFVKNLWRYDRTCCLYFNLICSLLPSLNAPEEFSFLRRDFRLDLDIFLGWVMTATEHTQLGMNYADFFSTLLMSLLHIWVSI